MLCKQCLLGHCQVSAPYSWKHGGVLHMSLPTDDKVAFEESRCLAYVSLCPGAKTIYVFGACPGAQLTICAQK